MKKDILKIAGVKSEKEFYYLYPTEEAFKRAFPKEFKKAKMGAAMVKKQLTQLTDFSNPPQAKVGDYIGGGQSAAYKPMNYTELYDNADYANTGSNRQMRMQDQNLAAQQQIAANSGKKGGVLDMLGQMAPQLDALSPDNSDVASYRADFESTFVPKGQSGFMQGLTNFSKKATDFSNKAGKSIGQGYDKVDKSLGKIGGVQGGIGIAGDLMEGFQQLKEEKNIQKGARQANELSGLTKQVAGLAPDIQQRKYARPEDMAFGSQEMGQAYGSGTNFLAEYGAMVGGNPTEIQNMYNPGDLYMDLGYEPLSDSEIVKQYRAGGFIPRAQFGIDKMAGQAGGALGSLIGGGKGRPTAGGKIGSTIGSTVGKFIPIPGASAVLGAVGGIVGGIAGGKSAAETERLQNEAQQNTESAAFMSGAQGLRNQFSNVMEDGGWVSHDWQPQVITQFGGYNLKDLLKDDPTMDTLRAGGHLKEYTAPSEKAMETYAMGGDLTIDGRGDIDFMGYNPVTAASGANGYIGISRGPSHDNGGFNIDYAGNKVEIEGGETIIEKKDGGSVNGDKSVVVLGDMKVGNQGDAIKADVNKETLKRILKGKDLKNVKFKHIGNEIAKRTSALNKAESKYIDLANSVDTGSKFGLLGLKTAEVGKLGIEMQYKDLDNLQSGLIDLQTAYHDAAEEHGYDDTPKFLEDIKKGKVKQQQAAMGGKFSMAQDGYVSKYDLSPWKGNKYGLGKKTASAYSGQEWENIAKEMGFKGKGNLDFQKFLTDNPNVLPYIVQKHKDLYGSDVKFDSKLGAAWQGGIDKYFNRVPMQPNPIKQIGDIPEKTPDKVTEIPTSPKTGKLKFADAYSMLYPYIKPLIRNPLDPTQLAGDMYALASNQLEPVKAQQFTPQLETPYSVSFQDQMNANQADFNAMARQLGSNPAALAQLAAQKYAANTSVLGQQARANQQLQMEAYNRNRSLINDASLKNLAILDQQYQRQSQARSNTKAQTYEALSSIGDKYARNRAETLAANVQANMYPDYAFGPKGRIMKTGLTQFNIPTIGDYTSADLQKLAEAKKIEETKGSKTTAKNGSLVKAIKNL